MGEAGRGGQVGRVNNSLSNDGVHLIMELSIYFHTETTSALSTPLLLALLAIFFSFILRFLLQPLINPAFS